MSGVGILAAFLGGVLSLLSPCAALLLPSFFAYAFERVGTLVARTTVFLAGLLVVLVPLGAGVGLVGQLVTRYRDVVTTVGAIVLVVLGVLTLLGGGFGSSAAGRLAGARRLGSAGSIFLLGTVYGLAGFCSGPLLGSVLTVAAVGADPGYGALLLAFYATGMAAPLFVLALLWDRMGLSTRAVLRGRELRLGRWRVHSTSLVSGLLFVAVGILFLVTDGTADLGGLSGVDTQFAWQAWVQAHLGGVGDLAVVLVVVLVVLAVVLVRMWRRGGAGDASSTS
jgi:cytochrome c biogenesis protein CcdA